MLRTFIDKFLLLRGGYTWSRCTYYLQQNSLRTFTINSNSKFNQNTSGLFQNGENTKVNQRVAAEPETQKKELPKEPTSKTMDRNAEELYQRYFMKPDQPKNPRLLRVAIIGAPNSGKSTLINTLTGWKLNSVSKKVHTTRQNANTMFTVDNTQIIFVDTPGVLTRKDKNRYKCDGKMLSEPQRGVEEADVVGVVVDVSNKWTRTQLHSELLKVLYLHRDVPSFLILNKIDSLRHYHLTKQQSLLLDISRSLTEGKVGGKSLGRSKIDRTKQKKPEKLFDYLEQKYGLLKKKQSKNLSQKTHSKIEIDTKEDLASQFSKVRESEISDYLTTWLQVDYKARGIDEVKIRSKKSDSKQLVDDEINMEKDNSDEMQEHMLRTFKQLQRKGKIADRNNDQGLSLADFEPIVEGSTEFKNEYTDTGVLIDNSSDKRDLKADLGTDDDNVEMSLDLKKENSETENIHDGKYEDLDSYKNENSEVIDKSTDVPICESSGTELHGDDNSENVEKSVENIVKLEESYQSEFLTRILSRPHEITTDEATYDEEQRKDKMEISKEVEELKEAIQAVKDKYGWPGFDEVFPICALDGHGIDTLKDYLLKMSKPGDWIFHSSVITDQHPFELAKQCVVQCFLDNVQGYVPYTFKPEIIYWDVDEHNRLNVSVEVFVQGSYEMKLILQKNDAEKSSRIMKITSSARQALMDAFQCEVSFKLAIKMEKKRGSK